MTGDTRVQTSGSTTVVLYGADLVDALIDEGQAAVSASQASAAASAASAQNYANLAGAAETRVTAAADILVANVPVYLTKAEANAALAGLANGTVIEVETDESQSNKRTRYKKVSGAYVYAIELPRVPVGGSLVAADGNGYGRIAGGARTGLIVTSTNYLTQYRTMLLVDSTSEGILQLGNNGQNTIAGGSTSAGGFLRFLVNCTGDAALNGSTLGGTEAMRIDSGGNVLIGATTAIVGHRICRAGGAGSYIMNVDGGNGFNSMVLLSVDAGGYSSNNAAAWFGKNVGTNRSINAGGTINASGADYAEYMTKAPGCGTIAPGDVCGVDVDGKLTRTWGQARSYVIKSTDPAYVGGDTWSADVGPRPEREEDESEEAYAARLAPFEAALEAARQTVDRIAFSGQVPVNLTGDCEPGDYLVAVANGGGIGLIAVPADDITFEQYRRRVGKVWAIREGRPWVDVQHG